MFLFIFLVVKKSVQTALKHTPQNHINMWIVTTAILVLAISLWLLWRKKHFSQLKKLGIPGPEPSIFFGNLWDISVKTPFVCHKEWAKKYGKVFGYYMGTAPIVVVGDIELLRKIQISEFQKFINRPQIFLASRAKPQKGDGFACRLNNQRDKRWKNMRSLLSPSFTSGKMKLMSPIILNSIDTLIERIDEKARKNEPFDIYPFYQGLTVDVVCRTMFGIQIDCQRNPNEPLMRSLKTMLDDKISSWSLEFEYCFPELSFLWRYSARLRWALRNKGLEPLKHMKQISKAIIKDRRSDDSKRRNDFLQSMIDAAMSEHDLNLATGEDLTAIDDMQDDNMKEIEKNDSRSHKNMISLTDYEILDNMNLFFLGGSETTSTTLAFVTHFLLHFPDVQRKVRAEIVDLKTKEGKLDYSSIKELQYLDQVINETLRMYPPSYLFTNREVGEDTQLGKIRLKKGLAVQVPSHLIQHDSDYWNEPEKFDPERFSPENKGKRNPIAFQAFGAGPRNCIGLRFAQMEVKLVLVRILSKYELVPCDKTEKLDLNLNIGDVIIKPSQGVYLKAVPIRSK